MTIKLAHFPDAQLPHTIAYKINENMTVTAAFAQVGEGDKYDRAMGRTLARGRLLKGGVGANGTQRTVTYNFEDIGEINHRAITSFLSETHFPVFKGLTRTQAYALLRGKLKLDPDGNPIVKLDKVY
jgi:hypothetical protein